MSNSQDRATSADAQRRSGASDLTALLGFEGLSRSVRSRIDSLGVDGAAEYAAELAARIDEWPRLLAELSRDLERRGHSLEIHQAQKRLLHRLATGQDLESVLSGVVAAAEELLPGCLGCMTIVT